MSARRLSWALAAVGLVQIVLLVAVGWTNRFATGPDGIAYLRIASYYQTGQTELMVNAYWGPMLSWIIAPLLFLTDEPLLAARIAMGFSAVVFLAGCVLVLVRLELPRWAVLVGAAASALMSVRFSVDDVSPDLLVSGLMCLAASDLLRPSWTQRPALQVRTGVVFGIACLAKSVALPIGAVMITGVAGLRVLCRDAGRRRALQSAAVTGAALLLTAAPWIAVLSLDRGEVTFSTTARVAHTIVGPPDVDRGHPFGTTFAVPEAGRITWWEDPASMPYRHWSPFESAAYFRHQLRVVGTNLGLVTSYLGSLDGLRFGVIAAALGLLLHAPWRRNLREERWRWAGVAVASISVVYLPVYALGLRYYFAAFPFLFAAAVGLVRHLTQAADGWPRVRVLGMLAVAVSFAAPSAIALPGLLAAGGREPASRVLARGLREQGVHGPVAGDTMEGLLLAYFLGDPFYGGTPGAGPVEYRSSGASVVVVARGAPLAGVLAAADGFDDLDGLVFDAPEYAAAFPLHAFRLTILSAEAGPTRASPRR